MAPARRFGWHRSHTVLIHPPWRSPRGRGRPGAPQNSHMCREAASASRSSRLVAPAQSLSNSPSASNRSATRTPRPSELLFDAVDAIVAGQGQQLGVQTHQRGMPSRADQAEAGRDLPFVQCGAVSHVPMLTEGSDIWRSGGFLGDSRGGARRGGGGGRRCPAGCAVPVWQEYPGDEVAALSGGFAMRC